jgi:hypothetical protein
MASAGPASYVATYARALDELLLIAALVALVAGALSMVLIRQRDFVGHEAPAAAAPERAATAPAGAAR